MKTQTTEEQIAYLRDNKRGGVFVMRMEHDKENYLVCSYAGGSQYRKEGMYTWGILYTDAITSIASDEILEALEEGCPLRITIHPEDVQEIRENQL